MDRRSHSPDSSPAHYSRSRRKDDRDYNRNKRSWSRDRSRERGRTRRSRTRSRSRDRNYHRSSERDLYKDLINQDYQEDKDRDRDKDRYYYKNDRRRDHDRERRDRDRGYKKNHSPSSYDDGVSNSNDSHESDSCEHYYNQTPNNKIIVRGLAQHITEADISSDLMQCSLKPSSIRLIRKRKTGASRGFAFVEFSTEEEATRWMEYKQGILMLQDQYRAVMQYSISKDPPCKEKFVTDWYCAKCGVFNFKRRENCFKCYASREESEKGGEGSDEISNILTKKIMLRNLDVLTNEEGVLTIMQEVVPTLVSKISKILICRDPLTSTSRGICYLSFDNLVDSMNLHNALKALETPLTIESREVLISYCVDAETRAAAAAAAASKEHHLLNKNSTLNHTNSDMKNSFNQSGTYQYTLTDVPRLAEYSASMYSSNKLEHDHYIKYYTHYYITEITKGQFNNLPSMSQLGETANSGAAVAQSAIQRKQNAQKQQLPNNSHAHISNNISTASVTVPQMQTPKGNDGKKYAIPDITHYQYDETSGFYYDPITGLYYDPNSQYYFNNETNSYLYWDNENCTYLLAANQTNKNNNSNEQPQDSSKTYNDDKKEAYININNNKGNNNNKEQKQDKVKVAKKIVKDMEKWAKQLNQKKDMNILQPPTINVKLDDMKLQQQQHQLLQQQQQLQMLQTQQIQQQQQQQQKLFNDSGYADVGFSILEKKDKNLSKFQMELSANTKTSTLLPATVHSNSNANSNSNNSKVLVAAYGSDSDNDLDEQQFNTMSTNEKDYVDYERLTCLLCKRAFQSQDILNKHLKMSNLHKENLQKYKMNRNNDLGNTNMSNYRDRAKERRLKYGETDSPPINRSKERFQREMEKQQAAIQAQTNIANVPIGENNVGNRLLQKMGWTEGQGLGRSNQGRTNIIEAESRAPTAGLGSKTSNFGPGDDYKSYIKRMMKTRYEQVDVKE